jgi:hypothetical protein
VIQMPRMPEDLAAFEAKFFPQSSGDLPRVTRHWEITNTRYLLGAAGFLDMLNRQFDPVRQRFSIAERFDIQPKPGVTQPTKLQELTAVPDTNGAFALFEFKGAFPRAKLYTNWQVSTNEQTILDQLANPAFDVDKTLLVTGESPAPPVSPVTNEIPADVKFASYAPKDIVLDTTSRVPSILLLNDRFDPNWKVYVDGKSEALLHCNYIMRGVYLNPGSHKVEFRFVQPMETFYVSLAAVALGLALAVFLLVLPSGPIAMPETAQTKPVAKTSVLARP